MYHGGTNQKDDTKFKGIKYLYSLANWSKEKSFSLDNITKVLQILENPQDKINSIIITGTNGKGSVSAILSSIFGAAGFSVGLNTSPHLQDISERIVVDGFPINQEFLSDIALELKSICEKFKVILSFHEAVTICAFMIFKEFKLDWQILEVGVGGKKDAANIVKAPKASVLVSVDFDHQALLGNKLIDIASEKVGIFRKDGLAVIGNLTNDVAEWVKNYCDKNLINSICYHTDYKVVDGCYYNDAKHKILLKSKLEGEHQIHNMAVAVATALNLNITEKDIISGLKNVFWPGRLELFDYKGHNILIDCAHNPAGIKSLISYFNARGIRDVNLGFGALSTKNWTEMLELLIPYVKNWSLLTPLSDNTEESSVLENYLSNKKINAKNYGTKYLEFLNEISKKDSKSERGQITVLTGSIYLIGAFRSLLTQELKPIWKKSEVK